MKPRGRVWVVSWVVTFLALAAACGSRLPVDTVVAGGPGPGVAGPGEGGQPVGELGESSPGVTDDEIRIGASIPISGLFGAFAGEEVNAAVDSYFKLVNAQGGVNGRKLKLVTYDNRGEMASQDPSNVRRLVEQDKVLALFALFGDSFGEYVTKLDVPSLTFGATAAPFSSRYPTMYPLTGNVLLWTHQFIKALKDTGRFKPKMRVAISYGTQFINTQPYVPLIKDSWEHAGAEVVSVDNLEITSADCAGLIEKMRKLDIDWWDFQSVGYIFCISGAQRVAYRPNIGWGTWGSSIAGLIKQAGPWSEGMWGAMNGDKLDTGAPRSDKPGEAIEEYRRAVLKYHPEMEGLGHLESPLLIGFWSGAKLLVEAVRAQGKVVTRKGVNEWLHKVEDFPTELGMPIGSLRPDCKIGSEYIWVGTWTWKGGEPALEPVTGYITSDYKERYGGDCLLTKIADDLLGVK